MCTLFLLTGCGPVPLVTGPKHRIANSRLRARSKLSKFSAPPRSRINTKRRGPWLGAWVSKYNAAGQWIQVSLINLINPLKCFFGIEGYVARDKISGPGYDTLLFRLIPGDLSSACPHRPSPIGRASQLS